MKTKEKLVNLYDKICELQNRAACLDILLISKLETIKELQNTYNYDTFEAFKQEFSELYYDEIDIVEEVELLKQTKDELIALIEQAYHDFNIEH